MFFLEYELLFRTLHRAISIFLVLFIFSISFFFQLDPYFLFVVSIIRQVIIFLDHYISIQVFNHFFYFAPKQFTVFKTRLSFQKQNIGWNGILVFVVFLFHFLLHCIWNVLGGYLSSNITSSNILLCTYNSLEPWFGSCVFIWQLVYLN